MTALCVNPEVVNGRCFKRYFLYISILLFSSPFCASLLCCRQYHQEIEDFVFNLVHKYEEQQRDEQEKTHFSLKPQVL